MQLSPQEDWYTVQNVRELDSPALLIYPDRIAHNIDKMILMVGDPGRLRPHVKTYKMAEVVQMQMDRGIDKFKCATIAEAEMLARCGAQDILLAYQPVGPKARRLLSLIESFPDSLFSTLVDNPDTARAQNEVFASSSQVLPVYIDLDVGMHRTGIPIGPEVIQLFGLCQELPNLKPVGLHVYDGHLRQSDPEDRRQACDQSFVPALDLAGQLESQLGARLEIVAGGTPTFPIHAARSEVICSPGTCLIWDWGYKSILPDLDFQLAGLVLSRVISKPGKNLICTDLGHKSIASENPHPRVHFLNLPRASAVSQSEEHLVLETERADQMEVGDELYGVPIHICPTCALYEESYIVDNKEVINTWRVVSRDRRMTI